MTQIVVYIENSIIADVYNGIIADVYGNTKAEVLVIEKDSDGLLPEDRLIDVHGDEYAGAIHYAGTGMHEKAVTERQFANHRRQKGPEYQRVHTK